MLKNPLTVVEAPAGYGKTVAVTEFLRKQPVTLVVTRAREEAPGSFWPDFCRVLAREIPSAGEASAALLNLGLPRDYAQNRTALELLRHVSFPRETFLVFDDCHALPRSFIDFCESLALSKGALSNVHAVCVTRAPWTGKRDAPRPQTSQSYLDQRVFTLTSPEIHEFFALYGIALSREAEREAHTKTGGWISALHLSLLWYKEHGEFSFFPEDTATRIWETVYAPLSIGAKELLLALAPLERFTAAQAAALYGRDATALLEELTGKNAFVAYDPTSRVYSLHAIFRHFLLNLLNDATIVPPERGREIYRACGKALHAEGELASAVAAWHKAGDFESALAALEENMTRNMVTEKAGLYFAMFKDCPEEILKRYMGASFKYAIAAFSAGDFQAFGARMAWLSERCAALPAADAKGADNASKGRNQPNCWPGELEVLRALVAFNDIEAMSGHHKKALALLGGATTSLYGPDSPWTLGSPSVLFMFYRTRGKLAHALRLMHECMPYYYRLTDNHGAGAELLMEAEALYHAGEFAEAETLCQTALNAADIRNQRGNVLCALFLRMRLALVSGDAQALFGQDARSGLLAGMRGLITENRNYFLLHTVDLCEGWLYAALGIYEKIPEWLRAALGDNSPLYSFAQGFFHLVHGRAQLLAGNYDAVITGFRKELAEGKFRNTVLFSVYAHIYLAAALRQTGKSREAAEALKTALDTALPDALYMPFAENDDLIGPVLAKALPGTEHREALSRVAALAKRMKTGCEAVVQEIQNQNLPSLLSDRELEVARLVVEGFSNQNIAEKLHIKDSTVKAHLTHIFQKTGVQNRSGLHKIFIK